jgi:hypothetical protein
MEKKAIIAKDFVSAFIRIHFLLARGEQEEAPYGNEAIECGVSVSGVLV